MRTVTRVPRPCFPRTILPLLLAGSLLAICAPGCSDDESTQGPTRTVFGSGTIDEETREVADFTAISLQSIGKVLVELGPEEGLRIETDDNLLTEILTEVRDGVLIIRTRDDTNIRPTDTVTYYLDAVSLDDISISGVGSVEAPGLSAQSLALTITGVGDMDLTEVDAETLDLTITGIGNVALAGNAPDLDITVSGTGHVEARFLQSAVARIAVSGLGDLALRVSETLDCTIAGEATICYLGEPDVTTNISGAGTVLPCE